MQQSLETLFNKVLTTFYRRMVVVAGSLSSPASDKLIPAAEVRLLTADDAADFGQFNPHYARSEFHSRIANGEQCFAVIYETRIVHVGWASTRRTYVPYLHCHLTPAPGSLYQHGNYTHARYRQHGFAGVRANYMRQYYQARGILQSVGLVALENKTGLQAAHAYAFRNIGQFTCLRVGPWQRIWQQAWGDEPLPVLQKSVTGLQ